MEALLNDSKDWDEESASKDGKPWMDKFKLKKEDIKEMMKEMKEKTVDRLLAAKVRPTIPPKSLRSKEQELKVPETGGAEARTNVVTVVVRKIQTVVRDHGYVLDLIKEMILKMQNRLNTIEENVKFVEDTANNRAKLVTTLNDRVRDVETHIRDNDDRITANNHTVNNMNEGLKEFEEKLTKIEEENYKLIKDKQTIENEMDETRQRGLKGNIIVSSPDKPGSPSLLVQENHHDGSREDEVDMIIRLIKKKTTVALKKESVLACHRLGEEGRKKQSYLVRISDHKNGSDWDTLATGMVTGKIGAGHGGTNFTKDNIHINFQLTNKRMELVHICRKLVKMDPKPISKYSVNQNGRITVVKVAKSKKWEVVKDREQLAKIAGVQLPSLGEGMEGRR